jgi:hypothetical protein
MMTVGEIYDFNINDEFHGHAYGTNVTPNAQRIKIIGKYFSSGNDTVFYIRYHDNYSSVFNCCPNPHLDYNFSIGTDTVFYTDLDSLINYTFIGINDSCNSYFDTVYYSPQYCNAEVFEYERAECTCCIDAVTTREIYGLGLGMLEHHFYDAANFIYQNWNLFYYKKDTLVCGTPDLFTEVLSLKENKGFLLFPNPTSGTFKIQSPQLKNSQLEIFNMLGEKIYSDFTLGEESTVSLNAPAGIYFVRVSDGEKAYTQKLVVE